MTEHTTPTFRQRVDTLPASYNSAVQSAMVNAYDLGLREDADDDGEAFWRSVLGEVAG